MNVKYPFQFDSRGRSAASSYEQHIREMVEQVLFTSPGERVNRPNFGTGLLQLVFEPNSLELATATQYLVQSALQQWLGDLIDLQDINLEREDSSLSITVEYIVRKTGNKDMVQLSREMK